MRLSRTIQLTPEAATVHMYWRCHNKEYYLNTIKNKNLYMSCIFETMNRRQYNENVKIYSYCVMGNHYHQSTAYYGGSHNLSSYMRAAHSLFGIRYNKSCLRSGKVAESRPKTTLIQDCDHEMRMHFYVEANPIRANICKIENLRFYKYCSYKFYAFGIRDEYTCLLTEPSWYKELGSTPKERQKKYRLLFREYLKQTEQSRLDKNFFSSLFFGHPRWCLAHKERIKKNNTYNSS